LEKAIITLELNIVCSHAHNKQKLWVDIDVNVSLTQGDALVRWDWTLRPRGRRLCVTYKSLK